MTEAAQSALDEFAAKLTAKGDARFTLDRDSSDLLLVLLLPKVATYIVSSSGDASPTGWRAYAGLPPAFKSSPRWKAEVQLMHPLHEYIAKQLAEKLKARKVVVWYDARREFAPFVAELRGGARTSNEAVPVTVGGVTARLAEYDGSMFELRAVVEPFVCGDAPPSA